MMSGVSDKRKRMKSSAEKKRRKDKVLEVVQPRDKENYDKFRTKKQRKNQTGEHEAVTTNKVDKEDGFADMKEGNEKRNLSKKKKKNVKKVGMDTFNNEVLDDMEQQNVYETVRSNSETQVENVSHEDHTETDAKTSVKTSKSMKACEKKKETAYIVQRRPESVRELILKVRLSGLFG